MPTTPSEGIDVLVIDDLRFMRFPAVYARTVREARSLLFGRPWREVWLDYDMGEVVEAESHYDTTDRLAVEMERLARDFRPAPIGRVVIHTSNPVGAARLTAALTGWYELERVDARDYLAPEP